MANVFVSRTVNNQNNVDGGYKQDVLFAPVDTFATFAAPTGSPIAAGDKVTLVGNHTFNASQGWIKYWCKKHSVTSTAETTGEDGAKTITHKGSLTLLGDDASTLEQLQDLVKREDCLFLIKDADCINATQYVQYGDSCLQPSITVSFDGKTTKEGSKEYKVDYEVKNKKFFYSGTITLKP